VNAYTYGTEKSVVVLHTGLLERLNDEETLAVIAHEVGHIHAEHVLYLTAARIIEFLTNASVAKLLPGSEILKFIISAGISSSLLAWARRAELSCDRAALLVTQDPHVVGKVMMKLSGGTMASKIDYDLFLEQGREFKKTCEESALDKFWANIINAGQTHPFPIWRVGEILDWVESGQYNDLMKKK
jgi:Zn-dependent protease with chaperone function